MTTADVATRLDTAERTVRLWCKQGKFSGARVVETPRGDYWLIPASALNGFEKPKRGRIPQPKPSSTKKTATAKLRASSGAPTGKKKGSKK